MSRGIPWVATGLVLSLLVLDLSAVPAHDDDHQERTLASRVTLLERKLANRSTEIDGLKSQISRLTRELSRNRVSSVPSSTTVSSADLMKMKRDTVSIASRLSRLETRVAGIDRTSLQRDVDRLRQKVVTLQSDVQRLKSR